MGISLARPRRHGEGRTRSGQTIRGDVISLTMRHAQRDLESVSGRGCGLVRLATWARLERMPTGDLLAPCVGHDTDKLRSTSDAQAAGLIDSTIEPAEVYALVTAVSMIWSPASVLVAASR